MLYGIQPHEVDIVWPIVAPLIQQAIDKGPKDFSVQDILERVLDTEMQLWVWDTGSGIEACCITTIVNYPQKIVCEMPYIAGGKMRDWLSMEAVIVEWARSKDCTQLGGCGRIGWLRVLKNWRDVGTKLRRDI